MGLALTLQGLNFSYNPSTSLSNFGLTPTPHMKSPLIPIMSSRNIALGISFLTFGIMGMSKAAGIMMVIGSLAPVVDWYVAEKWGGKGKGMSHAIGAVVSAGLGGGLIYYAES